MKVCLIYPGKYENTAEFVPLGLVYLATVLKQAGHEVRIVDLRVHKLIVDDIREYDVYCLSVMTSQVKEAIEISKTMRFLHTKRIIWGGLHPTLFSEQVLKADYVDAVVLGEAESVICDAVTGTDKIYRGKMLNFSELPMPDYSLLEMDKYSILYKNYQFKGIPQFNIESDMLKGNTDTPKEVTL